MKKAVGVDLPNSEIRSIIMRRDGISEETAEALICSAVDDLKEKLDTGEDPSDICQDWFGLEPDYLFELLERL